MEQEVLDLEVARVSDALPKQDLTLLKLVSPVLKRPTFTYKLASNTSRLKDTDSFHAPEYDFVEIGMAEDTDSLIYQANFKKLAQAIKAGWIIVSRDAEHLSYIKRRIAEIEIAQGQTFWGLIVELLGNLLRYHNCFLIKSRDVDASSGRVRTIGETKIIPIAGYFVASPETMRYRIGKDYNILAYKHVMPDGREKIFRPEDVIHFHVYRKTHHFAGTPAWTPVLDDVTALRRIEEHVENLIYQHIYPLFQYKVGTEKAPVERYEDGLTEIDVVKSKIQNMPTDGMIVTPERHEIKGLGSESRALRAESYLEHFKRRVISGSGLSEIDFGLGDTANRSTADTLSKIAIDNVKFYQANLANELNFSVIRELMMESTFNYDHSDEAHRVELQFNEVDVESQIKLQNHFMLMYHGNMITEGEARKHMGKDPMSDENREDTHLHRVDKLKAEWQAEADIEKANTQAKNRQQPTNQHGKKSGPSARKSSLEDGLAAEVYGELAGDISTLRGKDLSMGYLRQLFLASAERAKRVYERTLTDKVYSGSRGYSLTPRLDLELAAIARKMIRETGQDLDRLFKDAYTETASTLLSADSERLAIDILEHRVRFIERTMSHRAHILGKVAAMRSAGIQRAIIKSDPEGEDFETRDGMVIELPFASQEELPPFHPCCKCDLIPEERNV